MWPSSNIVIREAGAPSLSNSSRLVPVAIFLRSSTVISGGAGGGGTGTASGRTAAGAGGSGVGATGVAGPCCLCTAARRTGGGGTAFVRSFGIPGPTSRSGEAGEFFGFAAPSAALAVCFSTLLKTVVRPSLTFLPATPPADPAAAAPAASVSDCDQAHPVRHMTRAIRLIQHLPNAAYQRLVPIAYKPITLSPLQKSLNTTSQWVVLEL